MFVVSKPTSTFGGCSGAFASSSCQSEYNGKMESALESKSSLGGLKSGLRRNSSDLTKKLSNLEICHADATQIEIDFTSATRVPFYVRVEVPTGETGILNFANEDQTSVFTPSRHGCGHGVWKFVVCTTVDGKEVEKGCKTMNLDGVGTLFFKVVDEMHVVLHDQEFLHMGQCHKRRH